MSLFWIDKTGLEITYDDLFNDLIKEGEGNVYIQNHNPYFVFVNLLRNLLSQKKSIMLDSDFSSVELLSLEISDEILLKGKFFQSNLSDEYRNLEMIFDSYERNKNFLEIEIFTSGTSGKPKKVSQSLLNVIRAVRVNSSYVNNIWGFAYNPTHFAGLQVFFQALFNKNTLVYIFDSDYKLVNNMFNKYDISHLSCTPTFMKMLIPYIHNPKEKVLSLTFGGEKFDEKLKGSIIQKFPKAKIKNVYASTEAGSLLRTDGDSFTIPERYKFLIKIENDELLINVNLLGKSDTFIFEGDWYRTGDLVKFIDDKKFKFVNRKSEMINVGGYKVNPSEIEDLIRNIEGVIDVIVLGRANSLTGNIIVANIIKSVNQDDKVLKERIKSILVLQLQDFKIPRIINFVETFDITRTGKIKKS
jgi:acyl-CoA synthetase (AMP-forming)/AMP-acid ligase II